MNNLLQFILYKEEGIMLRISKKIFFCNVFLLSMVIMLNGKNQIEKSNIRIINHNDLVIELDLSTQILQLDINDLKISKLYPTIKHIPSISDFIPGSLLIAKSKQFNDGLLAVVEYLCQDGTNKFVGKREILRQILEVLNSLQGDKETDQTSLKFCRSLVWAASDLGGERLAAAEEVKQQARGLRLKFLSHPRISKPIGFYTWTKKLEQIYQQNKFLQMNTGQGSVIRLKTDDIRVMAKALSQNKRILEIYKSYLSFWKKFFNPFPKFPREFRSVLEVSNVNSERIVYCIFPPAISGEVELVERLYFGIPVPDGFSLIDT